MTPETRCPFCGEPRVHESLHGSRFRCGTQGPDINGDYDTGHTCDIAMYNWLLAERDAEINRLKNALRPFAEAAATTEFPAFVQAAMAIPTCCYLKAAELIRGE